jgi:hypothetical protein
LLRSLLQVIYFSAATLSLFASSMVAVSMLSTQRAPQSAQFWTVTIGVCVYLALMGFVLLGVGRHLTAIGFLAQSLPREEGARLGSHWRRLAVPMLLGGVLLVPVLLLIAWAILARLDQGFALFG